MTQLKALLVAALLVSSPVWAEDWRQLSGEEVREALTGRTVDYDGAWQDFRASGATLYNAGEDSWGRWDIRGDQYCSQWPPNSSWACYDVETTPDLSQVRFLGAGADVTVGRFRSAQ